MKRSHGLTIIELLIALAVIGVGLLAFSYAQVGSLRASARSALTTEAKTAANLVLEAKTAEVLTTVRRRLADGSTNPEWDSDYRDAEDSGVELSFKFIDFYYSCPTVVDPPDPDTREGDAANLRPVACSGSERLDDVTVAWRLEGQSGIAGEGVVDIVVTADHRNGARLTVGNTITCYDVYPAPKHDTPQPCPSVMAVGAGGRP